MSIWERRRAAGVLRQAGASGDATALDRMIGDRDWTFPAHGVRVSRFDAPSGSLARWEWGDPAHPRVILVPGATGSKEDFVLVGPLLAAAGYFVQSYDLAGQYESAAAGPANGDPFTFDLFVADLIALLEAGSTPAHVLGYSFAGTVAQLALVERPELFASLALLGAPPQPGQTFRNVRWIGPLSRVISARAIASLLIWGLMTNLNRVPAGRYALVRTRFGYTSRRSVDDIVGLMMRTPDLREEVHRSPVPKLVAVGHHDLWDSELHRDFAAQIGASIVEYPTGHSPCETTPHQLARDLVALYGRSVARA